MPYQDRHAGEAEVVPSGSIAEPVNQTVKEPNAARTIQIVIVAGLVVAIMVAIFGSY